jgi:hypothetical protein
MFAWIAQTPGAVPLSYLVQLPFVLVGHDLRILDRLPSIVFAIISCFLFWRVTTTLPLKRPTLALLGFMAVPLHYGVAWQASSFEMALCLSLLSTIIFMNLISGASGLVAFQYALVLTGCLFTNPYSYLPAIGYLLFLLRSAADSSVRRVIWLALPGTAIPPLFFFCYYVWARQQTSAAWITAPDSIMSAAPLYLLPGEALGGLSHFNPLVICITALLLIGFVLGVISTFGARNRTAPNRVALFSLAGAAVSVLGIEALITESSGPLRLANALFAEPALVILFTAGFEWMLSRRSLRSVPKSAAALVLVGVSAIAGITSAALDRIDVGAEAAAIVPNLTANSCVVFLSAGLSRDLFAFFQPALAHRDCLEFFHERIVVAEHPFVTADQKANADTFFRALNFIPVRTQSIGGGEIVVWQLPQANRR